MSTQRQDSTSRLALKDGTEDQVISLLIPILADTIYIYSLYKKYHWHAEDDEFYQYHLLFDKHASEQLPLVDTIAERIRTLGGKAPGMPDEVTSNKTVDEPADAGKDPESMIANMCIVHERFLQKLRPAIDKTERLRDMGTNDLLISDVLRLNEMQLWFMRSSLD